MSRRRAGALVMVAVGGVLAASPLRLLAQDGGNGLTSFNLVADASGMAVTFGNPTQSPYPVAGATIPQTMATLSPGPAPYALSSAAWPGPLIANLGSLSVLLSPYCAPQSEDLPITSEEPLCQPHPAPEHADKTNYALRAEAPRSTPDGEVQSESRLGPMRARAEGAFAEAAADVNDVAFAGVLEPRTVRTESRAFVDGAQAVAESSCALHDVVAAAGQVTIEALRCEARAVSNGEAAEAQGHLVVEGLKVFGQSCTVDQNGVRCGSQSGRNPADAVVDALNRQLLHNFGIEIFLTRPRQEVAGAEARYSTGSLVIIWDIPGSGGQRFLASLGGANVVAQATPGFTFPLPELATGGGPPPSFTPPAAAPPPRVESNAVAAPPVIPPQPFEVLAPVGGPSADSTPAVPRVVTPPPLALQPAAHFGGIGPGQVVVALAGAALAAAGLRRLATGLLDRPPETCSLEGEPT